MEKKLQKFLSLHPAGRLLCLLVLVLPTTRLFLYPNMEGSWQYYAYNINVSLAEVLFIAAFILGRRKRAYQLNHITGLLWIAFLVWAAVALGNIPGAPTSAVITMQFFIHFFFAVAFGSYLRRDPAALEILIKTVVLSVIIWLPVFLLKLSLDAETTDFYWGWSLPGFTNVRHLDYFLSASLGAIGFLFLLYKNRNMAWFLLAAACWLLIFWSGGRGSAIAALGALSIGLIIIRPDGCQRLVLLNLAALFLGAVISLFSSSAHWSIRFISLFKYNYRKQ